MESEFGKGFIYNLFLFAKHWWKIHSNLTTWEKMRAESPDLFTEKDAVSLWFNGAADHFYELEVPPQWKDTEIGKIAERLQDKGIRWRMEELGTKEDFFLFFDELEELCMLIDKELGLEPIKAKYN